MELSDKLIWPDAGRYVVGVSGGIDSFVLLNLLANKGEYHLVAVYVDHGWRDSSGEADLVQESATKYGVEFRKIELNLSTKSEAEARQARYQALKNVQSAVNARAIITAHHLDDQIETVLLNVLRGTGRVGLSPLQNGGVLRPLLKLRRREIEKYAHRHEVSWIEDPTNQDRNYRRNWIRHELLPRLRQKDPDFDAWIIEQIGRSTELNKKVESELRHLLQILGRQDGDSIMLDRKKLAPLSVGALQELILFAGRQLQPGAEIDRRTVEQLAFSVKTGKLLAKRALTKRLFAEASRDTVAIAFKAQ